MEPRVPFENEYIFGNALLEMIPHPTNWVGDLFTFITLVCHYMGGVTFFVILLPVLYLFYNRKFASFTAIALFSTGIVNGLFKYFFMSPRPFGLSEQFIAISSHVKEYSFGLPSGHAHVSILVWGLFFLHFKNKLVKAISVFFIIFGPLSRMYAGVHYPGDVLGGLLCGLITLILMQKYKEQILSFPEPNKWTNAEQKIRSFSLLILALTLSPTLLELIPGNTVTHLQSLSQVITASASMAGFFIGLVLLIQKYPSLPEKVDRKDRGIAILLLILGVALIYFGMSYISKNFIPDNSLYRYLRYFLLNFYLVFFVYYLLENKKKKKTND